MMILSDMKELMGGFRHNGGRLGGGGGDKFTNCYSDGLGIGYGNSGGECCLNGIGYGDGDDDDDENGL